MNKKRVEFDPVKKVEDKEAQSVVWSTASLNAAVEAKRKGLPLKANPFLNNDIQLLKPDLVFRRTPEEVEDWMHCKEDTVFFANKCYLKTPLGIQRVKMRDYQEDYLRICDEYNYTILLACRQAGKSISNLIDISHTLLFNVDINGLLLSKSGQAGIDMLDKLKQIYRFLPWHLKAGINVWNVHQVSFDNNCNVTTESFSPTSALGKTINYLVLDEFAWMPANDVDMFYQNVIPTLTTDPNAKIRICSTQNGFNRFYKLWQGAVKGENEYHPYKIDWQQVPELDLKTKQWVPRTEEWKRKQIRKLGSEEEFQYQYGTTFASSDYCLVSRECLTKLHNRETLFREASFDELEKVDMSQMMTIAKSSFRIRKGLTLSDLKYKNCIVLVDLAEGCGRDSTVFHIFEVTIDNGNPVFDEIAYWKSKDVDLETSALVFWLMCQILFTPEWFICSVELNTYGILFENYVVQLNETDYKKEWSWRFSIASEFDYSCLVGYKKNRDDSNLPGMNRKNSKTVPGIRWNSSNKPAACMLLKTLIERDTVKLHDIVCIAELEAFEDTSGNGHYKASFGNDDLIMTCVQIPMLMDTPKWKGFIEELPTRNIFMTTKPDDGLSIYEEMNGFHNDIFRRMM